MLERGRGHRSLLMGKLFPYSIPHLAFWPLVRALIVDPVSEKPSGYAASPILHKISGHLGKLAIVAPYFTHHVPGWLLYCMIFLSSQATGPIYRCAPRKQSFENRANSGHGPVFPSI